MNLQYLCSLFLIKLSFFVASGACMWVAVLGVGSGNLPSAFWRIR